jgi:group II intron reverse transcriptase/maturase
MRTAEAVLEVIRERGTRGLPLEDIYRQLYNPQLYLRAYGRIARNRGATTPGTTPETVDGMSLTKIHQIIEALRFERYRWTPARRTYIPKPNGKQRPLGIPTWSDKLLQEVLRSILEAYYEPQFSDRSYGFRPGRGCHTALGAIYHRWVGTKWFLEGDIKGCFDNIDHQVLLASLRDKLHDHRFVRLIEALLQAGYLEDWRYHATYSGTPQGGVVSPILANIYLDKLDRFVERVLLPRHNRGDRRRANPAYIRLRGLRYRLARAGRHQDAEQVRREMQQLPALDPDDPGYRRLHYLRYADDWLIGFVGPRCELEAIKRQIAEFLRDTLKLELSGEKTLVTHAHTAAARFLGYDIVTLQNDAKRDRRGYRSVNGQIGLKVPAAVARSACARYCERGKPAHRTALVHNTVFTIVSQYQAEYRGLVQYYQLAYNLHRLNRLQWTMEQSLTKTVAHKLRTTVAKVYARFKATVATPAGTRNVLLVTVERGAGKRPLVAQWGGIPLRRQSSAVLDDQIPEIWNGRTELLERLLADTCELCGSRVNVQVHHIRHLADLQKPGRAERPTWVRVMATRRRKTLVVCAGCHGDIHAGRPHGTTSNADSRHRRAG